MPPCNCIEDSQPAKKKDRKETFVLDHENRVKLPVVVPLRAVGSDGVTGRMGR